MYIFEVKIRDDEGNVASLQSEGGIESGYFSCETQWIEINRDKMSEALDKLKEAVEWK